MDIRWIALEAEKKNVKNKNFLVFILLSMSLVLCVCFVIGQMADKRLESGEVGKVPTTEKIVNVENDKEIVKETSDDMISKLSYDYESVEQMKADISLQPGKMVKTSGYYSHNDGGGAAYYIRGREEDDVEDGGKYHFVNSDLTAELIIENNIYNVKQFGAKGDDSTDDTEKLQLALDSIETFGTCYVPKGIYVISSGLVMKKRTTLKGDSYYRDDCYPFGTSVIRVQDGVSDITAITITGINNENRCSIIGITLTSTSAKTIHNEGTGIGLKYELQINEKNVNGIDMNRSSHLCTMENVSVNGFSGTGIILGGCSSNSNIFAFGCSLGIDVSTDAILDKFMVWGCENGIQMRIANIIKNGRIDETSKFPIIANSLTNYTIVDDILIDQCGYAGIALLNGAVLNHTEMNVTISRSNSYYYGLNCEDIKNLPGNIVYEALGKIYIQEDAQLSNSIIRDYHGVQLGLDDKNLQPFSKFWIVNKSVQFWGDSQKTNKFVNGDIDLGKYVNTGLSGEEMFERLVEENLIYCMTPNNRIGSLKLSNDEEMLLITSNRKGSRVSGYNFNLLIN